MLEKRKTKNRLIGFRGTDELIKRIRAAAQKENRTASNWIETLILKELDKIEGSK